MKGLPGNPETGANGQYTRRSSLWVQAARSRRRRKAALFTPEYKRVLPWSSRPSRDQDYSVQVLDYEISGSTGMPGVVMKGFPEDTATDETGFYRVTVTHGWAGKITPEKPG